jgi:hypothetical protein
MTKSSISFGQQTNPFSFNPLALELSYARHRLVAACFLNIMAVARFDTASLLKSKFGPFAENLGRSAKCLVVEM